MSCADTGLTGRGRRLRSSRLQVRAARGARIIAASLLHVTVMCCWLFQRPMRAVFVSQAGNTS